MSLIKRPSSPYWYVRVQRNGRAFWLSTKETNRSRAQARLPQLLASIHDQAFGQAGPGKDVWFDAWWGAYWALRPGTTAARLARFTTPHIERHLGRRRLRQLTSSDLARYIRDRLAEGMAPTTIRTEGDLIRQTLAAAIRDGLLVGVNPASLVEWPTAAVRTRVLSREEQAPFLRSLPSDSYRQMVEVALATGLRGSELVMLRVEDITWTPHVHLTVIGKGKKRRVVPVYAPGLAALRAAADGRTTGQLWPTRSTNPRNRVSGWDGVMRRAWARAGLPGAPVSSHTFRHTFSTRFLQAGGDIYLLSKVLGHSSVAITEKVYAHLRDGDVVQQALLVQMS